jgi:glutamate-1-semialdehyde 2,1-aminomutase
MRPNRLRFEKSKAFGAALERLVPGGAHTYSRGRDQFPIDSPNGIVRGAGARVWDADGNRLVDWSMGLTSVSLGHAWPSVNAAVVEAIANGVNFQRPAELELRAAEAMVGLTGDDMVKFARHGSSVTTAAVKLARAFTGRAIVAVPAEHPFFSFDDWFIGTTPCDFGIPDALKKYTTTFSYGRIESLHALFKSHPDDIACVMMEPVKFDPPPEGYLQAVREMCTRYGAVLVLDEMISGLKLGMPGAQARFGVRADIATWGKGISNGFAMAALTGRGDIMRLGGLEPEGARKLFLLSSTHGGECVGFAALLATLREFRQNDLIAANVRHGVALRARLQATIAKHGLDGQVRLAGYPELMLLETDGPAGGNDAAFRTLFLQEMIARGVLFQGLFVLTPSHGPEEFDDTVVAFDGACAVYREALAAGRVDGYLTGPAIKAVFRKHL